MDHSQSIPVSEELDIGEIDRNLKVPTELEEKDIQFHSVLKAPFRVYGVFYENGMFRRLPEAFARSYLPADFDGTYGEGQGVHRLHGNTAGGRVRFSTDSPYVAISVKFGKPGRMAHFALTGSEGFDLYVREKEGLLYESTFVPPFKNREGYESIHRFHEKKMRQITIHFPLYSEVKELYIGLAEGAFLGEGEPYRFAEPIVYYGHSMTQGACATHPGNAYPNMLSAELDVDHVNLGFSGNAFGEAKMAEQIAKMKMKLFVMDYDHNADDVAHLERTHEPFFKIIREAHPDLPVIMMSAVAPRQDVKEMRARKAVVKKTYENAVKRGDRNVYFWDGEKEFAPFAQWGTVEGSHPNDLGFRGMAKSLLPILKSILNQEEK